MSDLNRLLNQIYASNRPEAGVRVRKSKNQAAAAAAAVATKKRKSSKTPTPSSKKTKKSSPEGEKRKFHLNNSTSREGNNTFKIPASVTIDVTDKKGNIEKKKINLLDTKSTTPSGAARSIFDKLLKNDPEADGATINLTGPTGKKYGYDVSVVKLAKNDPTRRTTIGAYECERANKIIVTALKAQKKRASSKKPTAAKKKRVSSKKVPVAATQTPATKTKKRPSSKKQKQVAALKKKRSMAAKKKRASTKKLTNAAQ